MGYNITDMNNEKIIVFIQNLEEKHKILKEKIEVLYAEKADEKYITNLKKEKLKIKDEINYLKKHLT
jgi:hypothetical protein